MLKHFVISGRVISGWDQQKAASREHLAPEISERSLFSLEDGEKSAEVVTDLISEGMEGLALLHRTRSCAVPKDFSSSGALPDPEVVRQVTASPLSVPDLPFLCQRSPSWYGVSQSREGFISHQACQLVRRKLISSSGCKTQWKDVNQFLYCHISPEAMGSGDVLFLSPCLLPSASLPRAQGLQLPVGLQKQLIHSSPTPPWTVVVL